MIGLWYNQAMLNRQKKCLREIIASYFGATCEELCELGGIGEKTLRNDIGILQDALQKYGLFLREEKNRLWIPKMDPVKRTPEKTTDAGKTGFCITESFSFGKLFS